MGGESIVRRNYNHSKSNGTVLSIEKAVPAGGGVVTMLFEEILSPNNCGFKVADNLTLCYIFCV
jgi:hypothetical protein